MMRGIDRIVNGARRCLAHDLQLPRRFHRPYRASRLRVAAYARSGDDDCCGADDQTLRILGWYLKRIPAECEKGRAKSQFRRYFDVVL